MIRAASAAGRTPRPGWGSRGGPAEHSPGLLNRRDDGRRVTGPAWSDLGFDGPADDPGELGEHVEHRPAAPAADVDHLVAGPCRRLEGGEVRRGEVDDVDVVP